MSEFSAFREFLALRLKGELPGFWAQVRMAPLPTNGRVPGYSVRPDARVGAVLALVTPGSGAVAELLLTLRRPDLSAHAGQISFPGGRQMEGEDLLTTALRETEEEIGLEAQRLEVLGKLSPLYIPPSNHFVHPFVGASAEPDPLRLQPSEVEEVLRVPLSRLTEPGAYTQWQRQLPDGLEHRVPAWQVHPRVQLWGATAMMTAELLALYEEFRRA